MKRKFPEKLLSSSTKGRLLLEITRGPNPVKVTTHLWEKVGISKATGYRYLKEFEESGLVEIIRVAPRERFVNAPRSAVEALEITSKFPKETAIFYRFDQLPQLEFFGYEPQIEAGMAIGLNVAEGAYRSALVFGYPGTGKSAFGKVLAQHINSRFRTQFSLLDIKCDMLSLEIDKLAEIRNRLKKIMQDAESCKPLIIIFDELEAICPPLYAAYDYISSLTPWMRGFTGEPHEKTLILGVTNSPMRLDSSVVRRFQIPIYFEPTSSEVISEIIRKYLGLENYKKISSEFVESVAKYGLRPMGADVITACNALKDSGKDFSRLSVEEIVDVLLASTPFACAISDVKRYEEENRSLIAFSSQHVIPYWSDYYRKVLRKAIL